MTNSAWSGLVLDDYRVVLPLPFQRKIGPVGYVARPTFTQQCGPWGLVQAGDVVKLLAAIPAGYLKVKLPLREGLTFDELPEGWQVDHRNNYTIDLSGKYEEVHANYHKTIRRKLRRYPPGRIVEADVGDVVELYSRFAGEKAGLKPKHYRALERVAGACMARGYGACVGYENDEGALLANGFFPSYQGRIINLFACSTELGYRQDGMSRLLNELIRQNIGPRNIFDFEGSDIPSIAQYFSNFGPVKSSYPRLLRTAW